MDIPLSFVVAFLFLLNRTIMMDKHFNLLERSKAYISSLVSPWDWADTLCFAWLPHYHFLLNCTLLSSCCHRTHCNVLAFCSNLTMLSIWDLLLWFIAVCIKPYTVSGMEVLTTTSLVPTSLYHSIISRQLEWRLPMCKRMSTMGISVCNLHQANYQHLLQVHWVAMDSFDLQEPGHEEVLSALVLHCFFSQYAHFLCCRCSNCLKQEGTVMNCEVSCITSSQPRLLSQHRCINRAFVPHSWCHQELNPWIQVNLERLLCV